MANNGYNLFINLILDIIVQGKEAKSCRECMCACFCGNLVVSCVKTSYTTKFTMSREKHHKNVANLSKHVKEETTRPQRDILVRRHQVDTLQIRPH
jgi:hypothetical protein